MPVDAGKLRARLRDRLSCTHRQIRRRSQLAPRFGDLEEKDFMAALRVNRRLSRWRRFIAMRPFRMPFGRFADGQ